MESKRAAIDLGAGSGRIFWGNSEDFREIHRFPNTWNFKETLASIREGLKKLSGCRVDSVSCDSWAQDFGLLDRTGKLFYEPVPYWSGRADSTPAKVAEILPEDELFRWCGTRRLSAISTLAQWKYMAENEADVLTRAARLLPVADLVNYKLCGQCALDFSLASAAKLLEPGSDRCHRQFLLKLGLDPALIGDCCAAPGVIGETVPGEAVPPEMAGIPVISGIGHDTASAFCGCDIQPGEAVLSLGSWAMLGTLDPETGPKPGTAVMGIVPGQYVRVVSRSGTRLLQQCVKQWQEQGIWPGYPEFDAAVKTSDFPGTFDAEQIHFPPPDGDMLKEISHRCSREPRSVEDFGKALCRSVAAGIADGIRVLEKHTGGPFRWLKVSGGGIADGNLLAELQKLLDCPVNTVCREAAVKGNLLIQERIIGKTIQRLST